MNRSKPARWDVFSTAIVFPTEPSTSAVVLLVGLVIQALFYEDAARQTTWALVTR